jgi:cyclophilin family peptidyl-prolyl cis-trans isomerase
MVQTVMITFLSLPAKFMKMKIAVTILFTITLLWGTSCSQSVKTDNNPVVLISTDLGDIKVKLYNETPLHRDNFLKLAGEGYFDDILFHRVINHFMIQSGDPDSKGAAPGIRLGNGGPDYTIPAEFVPALFHKKGALAAARQGDQVNPQKASSGSQFYIVQGKVWRAGELDTIEMKMNGNVRQNILKTVFAPVQEELNKYRQEKNEIAFNKRVSELQVRADSLYNLAPKFKFTENQRETYLTSGGYPFLDGAYTVFGEVLEGLDVLDKIAAVKTDQFDRPVQNVKIKMKVLRK